MRSIACMGLMNNHPSHQQVGAGQLGCVSACHTDSAGTDAWAYRPSHPVVCALRGHPPLPPSCEAEAAALTAHVHTQRDPPS